MATFESDLSVVIPSLNEADPLPDLLGALSRQRGLSLEVVVADGGSRDGTAEACKDTAGQLALPLQLTRTPPGRGRQMNEGARVASAPDLLFLHADTRIEEAGLLAQGRACIDGERNRRRTHRVAGHFGLRFRRSDPRPSGAYYFYEAKTRLNRLDCINGDQGFWLSREYFEELGGFDESLPYLEDARLAGRVFDTGTWITLPGRVATSARRFELEGLRQRQTLNALLHNFDAIGLHTFFEAAAGAYRDQGRAGRLRLKPFQKLAHRLGRQEGFGRFLVYWYRTGGYVAQNAWQLAFALDCTRSRRRGYPPGDGPTPWLERYDRLAAPLVVSPVGQALAALATAAWFYGSMALGR